MNELKTPDAILGELVELREKSARALNEMNARREAYIELKFKAEAAELTTYLEAQGTVADRQAVAKLKSLEIRKEAETAKGLFDHVAKWHDQLRSDQINVQKQADLVSTMYWSAGKGER